MDNGAFTLEGAAKFCSLSIPTMRALVNRADFPAAFKVGTRWVIPRTALERWMEDAALNRTEFGGIRK